MFRIGHYTGAIYNVDNVSLKDIHECCSMIEKEPAEIGTTINEIAADLHKKCIKCLGCEEAKKKKV